MSFTFVDLFAGIGGFHAALSALGGKCVYASEIDAKAASVYSRNWNVPLNRVLSDITEEANDEVMNVPKHDVLVGGFPCQPFSKSGKQHGMEEARGTLFWNIAKIIEVRRPKLVLLENVRNIAGPRHLHEWEVIISTLRDDLGYHVSNRPLIVSPHRIHPKYGGRPQIRERVFIAATRLPRGKAVSAPSIPSMETPELDWDPQSWNLMRDIKIDTVKEASKYQSSILSDEEIQWIEAWNEFVIMMRQIMDGKPLPGFPLWVDDWIESKALAIPAGTPKWKSDFLVKNSDFYSKYRRKGIDAWLKDFDVASFPPSRRKLEWQAQDAKTLWDTIMHMRPSGIRAKRATYVPALVAITQTSILGAKKRKLTPREGARLQGLPDWFDFGPQSDSSTFRQLGNGVNVGVVYNVLRAHVERDKQLLKGSPDLVESILKSSLDPSVFLNRNKH